MPGRAPLIGYFLSCEEYGVDALLEQASLAEKAGFEALWISDHYHPWNDEQGDSAFVWSVIGALSQVTRLPVTTAVTCPTVRIHAAVVAQAAATSHVLLEGRFRLEGRGGPAPRHPRPGRERPHLHRAGGAAARVRLGVRPASRRGGLPHR